MSDYVVMGRLKVVQEMVKHGLTCLILEGPPGCGKTAFSAHIAEILQAEYMYLLAHNWLSDEELFCGIHVGRVAAGITDPSDAYELGILAKAAIASKDHRVVVCLDEIEKAPQRVEALLLDFLQNGRVFSPSRELWQANLKQLTVILTSNGVRPLMDATLRRGFRHRMDYLPEKVESDILSRVTGAPRKLITTLVGMATAIRAFDPVSLYELMNLLDFIKKNCAVDHSDIKELINGWLPKTEEGRQAMIEKYGTNYHTTVWGEARSWVASLRKA